MSREQITCIKADALRTDPNLTVYSSITNYHRDGQHDPRLPNITRTEWANKNTGVVVLIEELDSNGCRHWKVERDERS